MGKGWVGVRVGLGLGLGLGFGLGLGLGFGLSEQRRAMLQQQPPRLRWREGWG